LNCEAFEGTKRLFRLGLQRNSWFKPKNGGIEVANSTRQEAHKVDPQKVCATNLAKD